MIDKGAFLAVVAALGKQGTADIEWAENIQPPADADAFAREIIFVICNSGMKNTVARRIFDFCMDALRTHGVIGLDVFGHIGKVEAINDVWTRRASLFEGWKRMMALSRTDESVLDWLQELPWVGPITKFHVAKNFGMQVVKPDVHLMRLAGLHGVTPQVLCERLAKDTGWKITTVDTLLWRACAVGIIDSRTGALRL